MKKNDTLGFGKRLKETRQKIELSQAQMARDLDLGKSTLCHLELGKARQVSGRVLLLIAKRLNVDPAWLLFGKTL